MQYQQNERKKTHMSISIDAEKTFDIIEHPIMINTLNKLVTEGNYLHIIKALYEKPTANILNGERLKAFPLCSGTKKDAPLTTSIQHNTGSSSQSYQARKRNKRHPSWKGRSKIIYWQMI